VSYEISKELVKRGHEVVVFTTDMYSPFLRFKGKENPTWVSGIAVYRFENLLNELAWKNMPIALGMASALKNHIQDFDVVHAHLWRCFQAPLTHHYARKYGVPYVLQIHGSLPRIFGKQRLKWIYDVLFGYRLLRDAAKVIALSWMEAEQYKGIGVPEEKIEVVPNGIDLSEYTNLPPKGWFKKKFGIDEDEKMVLYLGRIHKIKGIDILVKAFADVVGKLECVKLVVVGPDDGFLGELESLIKALRIEKNVLLLGPLYGRDKLEAYVDADVYVLPSRYETFPMSVLEAVACGTPIILTEKCGIAEYLKDKVSLVVKPNPEELVKALLEMLQDEERQHIFRRNGRMIIREFDISEIISKLEEVYEGIARQC